jgi:hypothetical protein
MLLIVEILQPNVLIVHLHWELPLSLRIMEHLPQDM